MAGLKQEDLAALRSAVHALEHPGLAARLTDMIGKPIELLGTALPVSASNLISTSVSKALGMALQAALMSLQRAPHPGSQLLHKALATASGAAGGAFGLPIFPIRKRRCRASRSLPWAGGLHRTMRLKADISPCAACLPKA